VLESITRETIIVLAGEAGVAVEQREIDRTELYLANEVFLCGSAAEIMPIVSIDGFVIGNGEPGPITISMLIQYLAITSGADTKYPEWRTVVHRCT
jgi:branched-chain amino acid aminotransferase